MENVKYGEKETKKSDCCPSCIKHQRPETLQKKKKEKKPNRSRLLLRNEVNRSNDVLSL